MRIDETEEVPVPTGPPKSTFKKYFYVNRNNFKVLSEADDKPIGKVGQVWGNALSKIVSRTSLTDEDEKLEECEEFGEEQYEQEVSIKVEDNGSTGAGSSTTNSSTRASKALGLIKKLPLTGPLFRKFGSSEEEEFKLPSEYAPSTEEDISEFDPDAIYILPVIGEEHIFEKRKTIVLRRDMFNAKHVKSTFNIVDKRNKFHFRVEAEMYELKRERVLTDQDGKPTMGLRYDFLKSSWYVLGGPNLTERRAVVAVKKSIFGNSCHVYVHLPPYPREFEPAELEGVKPLLKVLGKSIEDGFQIMNIHEDKQQARIKKDLEYLTHWTFGTDSYYVEVEPYIDTALMIAIGIIMEEETTTERERPYITGNLLKDMMLQVADNLYR